MKFRREDSNKLDLAATVTAGSDGKMTATMTSIPKAGISAEDLLGAVINLTHSALNTNLYVTLTSSLGGTHIIAGVPSTMLIGYGIVTYENSKVAIAKFVHSENKNSVTETLEIEVIKSAT